MDIRKIWALGLIQAEIAQIRELDVLSELDDLKYLSELERKMDLAAERISEPGEPAQNPLASLDAGLKRLKNFTESFESMMNTFERNLELNGPYSQVSLEIHKKSLAPLWKRLEESLESFGASITPDDWVNDVPGERVFCPLLVSYDQFKNGDSSLKLSQNLSAFLRDPSNFKEDCLRKVHRANDNSEKLLERRSNTFALLEEAKRKWEQGNVKEVEKLLERVEKESFSDVDHSALRESLSKFKDLREKIKVKTKVCASNLLVSGENHSASASWKSRIQDLQILKPLVSSSGFPAPMIAELDDMIVSLERRMLAGLSNAEKAEAKKKTQELRRMFLLGAVLILLASTAIIGSYLKNEEEQRQAELQQAQLQRREKQRQPELQRIEKQRQVELLREEKRKELLTSKFLALISDKVSFTTDHNLQMIWVRPGTFRMGSPYSEADRDNDESQHQVALTKGFYLGKYEVTQAQWEGVMGSNPSSFDGAERPVERVSWTDAVEFCMKLTERERRAGRLPAGMAYQLPTEAQWEYACRAGTGSAYSFGEDSGELHRYGNYADRNTDYGWSDKSHDDGFKNTSPVGNYGANAWGFHDMHGNVYEWCADWYSDYPSGALRDPVGPKTGSYRVIRGGSWNYGGTDLRSAERNDYPPSLRYTHLGFRVSFQKQ